MRDHAINQPWHIAGELGVGNNALRPSFDCPGACIQVHMRAEGQYGIASFPRTANGRLPINSCRSDIHYSQRGFLFACSLQALLEGRKRAGGRNLHIVMAQRISHLHCEEQVFF